MDYEKGAIGSAGLKQSTSTKPTTAFSAITDFDPVLGRLDQCVSRAFDIADKISGSAPSGVENAVDVPSPSNLIAQVQERRKRLVALVDRLESELARAANGL